MATRTAPAKPSAARASAGPQKKKAAAGSEASSPSGTRTLTRGLDVIEVVAQGSTTLQELATELGLPRSTAHRLASALVERRYLKFARGVGYALGPRLLQLGHLTSQQTSLQRVAREHLEALAETTGDTVHLGIREGSRALYLDKIPGGRRVEISSRIGELQPLRSTGIGKALILDASEAQLREYYQSEGPQGYNVRLAAWLERMRDYAKNGHAFDLEENEDQIRCVAVPIRDVTGRIVAAISVSSAAQYMSDARMHELSGDVQDTATAISDALGYGGEKPEAPGRKSSGAKKPGR
jgi:DNA-binding IclR family transcriptional regulator